MLYETSGPSNNAMALKSLSGRLRVTFLYQPMGDPSHPDIAVQHAFFSNIGSFSAAIEAYHVFDLKSHYLIFYGFVLSFFQAILTNLSARYQKLLKD